MIQRIQTVYLLIAAILLIVCACLPVGAFFPDVMGAPAELYNLCIISEDSGWDFSVCGLFILLAVSTVTSVLTIFRYNNRRLQSRNCLVAILFLLFWILFYVVRCFVMGMENATFKFNYTAVMPLAAIVFLWLARRAVIADEKLIRSVDRIR